MAARSPTTGNAQARRVGRALQAIHDRETAANAMGIDTAAYKLWAFVLSAVLAAAMLLRPVLALR